MPYPSHKELERLYSAGLEPSPWPDDMTWDMGDEQFTEREFRLASHHFQVTGQRPDWQAMRDAPPARKRLRAAIERWLVRRRGRS
jgi:hypothetical protein